MKNQYSKFVKYLEKQDNINDGFKANGTYLFDKPGF